ncbi:MAG: YbhB/YbcL family Raf kinase inhibitor-like protein [Anaerolineae bacterium]
MSSAFVSGGRIPARYTCKGDDVSPPLSWRGVPTGTASLALIMDDPDAPNGPFAHWVLYNIPVDTTDLAEHVSEASPPAGATFGRNARGTTRYVGPCPPQGSEHQYYFRLYALDQQLDLGAGATRAQVLDAMRGHILTSSELLGYFGR